jgi:protein-disulfide isomerase
VLGSPSAPVTLTYYGDLQCPVCKEFSLQTLPSAIQTYVRSGKMKVDYRSLQTATQDPATFSKQQVAALAAGRQARAWQYIELFYHEQGQEGTGYVTDSYLQSLAKQIPGLNVAQWKSARSSRALSDTVRADATAAQIAGANATPALIFKGPKGTRALSGMALMSDVTRAYGAVA